MSQCPQAIEPSDGGGWVDLSTPLRDVERRHIERVMHAAGGNQRLAARMLAISRWSLARRLRKYGLQVASAAG